MSISVIIKNYKRVDRGTRRQPNFQWQQMKSDTQTVPGRCRAFLQAWSARSAMPQQLDHPLRPDPGVDKDD